MSLRSRRAEHPSVTLELPQLDRYHDRAERVLTKTIAAYGIWTTTSTLPDGRILGRDTASDYFVDAT
ncbi:hypothetical protein PC129_g5608 [Phytophthora cactorum]|uniref:Uncharacterized protein n=1 Tax=Phytophthora cactorum TaxID=29920 RepID=A0A329T2D1_9STRA|nr:hypothetical protein Pcac1_g8685 [Phytophthora cactorum]KAG2830078.1 hypothetical protein PC111_g7510 [Phytophthora cactorum]KAG2832689.1 hypothetical protein PC112_g6792 [Phytophthora cactorum]KAG2864880.1 hypothetical protein PC113_g4181 [Phytophthora cactorum]KAG2911471.1 hypothetical protein PC114_g9325 [Phytophthora cactorum]